MRSASRTQNTVTIDVHAEAPGQVLINSGYDRGWQTSVGTVVRSGKQLAVDVPAGDHVVAMRYWPRTLTLGLIITAVTVLVLAFVAVRSRRARRDRV